MKAPDFNLPDQNGKTRSLEDYKGKWLLLYFYPKDFTAGCTKEACSFRDGSEEFKKLGIEIVGVSKDTVASHKKFHDKHNLTFSLLSDENLNIIKAYKSWGEKNFMGKTYEGIIRNSFLINPKGEIEKTYEKVNPMTHIDQIINDFKGLAEE